MVITRYFIYTCLSVASSLFLSACVMPFSKTASAAPNPEDQQYAICEGLKQDIANNDQGDYLHEQPYSPTTAARLYKEYSHYGCTAKSYSSKKKTIQPTQ